jgi:hypothetical protein
MKYVNRNAMTAIEVLAATVLASLMLGAVVGVLGGLSRQEKLLLARRFEPPWKRQLIGQLEWDLKNSRWMSASPHALKLEGFTARDFHTGMPLGRPATIEYLVQNNGPRRLLMRRETHVDEPTGDNARLELVLVDVERVVFGGSAISAPGAVIMPPQKVESVPVPGQLVVEVYGSNHAGPIISQSLNIR